MRIILTGSSTGIGHALAERLITHGHDVWGLARSTQDERHRSGGTFTPLRCDVTDWEQVEAAVRQVSAVWPHVDALITCAAIQGEVGRTLTSNPDNWRTTMRANIEGTFNVIRAFAPSLARAPRRAKIVCFSGGGASKARPNFSAYGIAKTGIVRLVETIAKEEESHLLDINAVAPGAIHTRMTEEVVQLGPEVVGEAEYASATKLKRDADIAMPRALDLVEWLLSPTSDGLSGRLISAVWDAIPDLEKQMSDLVDGDIYTLRRILPQDRSL